METRKNDTEHDGEVTRLSISAQFDDICRLANSFANGVEDEFANFVGISKSFKKERKPDEKIKKLKSTIHSQKRRIKVLETQIKHAKSLLVTEMDKAKKAEMDKRQMESKIQAITRLVLSEDIGLNEDIKDRIHFLSSTNFNTETQSEASSQAYQESSDSVFQGISFDTTSEDVDLSSTGPQQEYQPLSKLNAPSKEYSSASHVQRMPFEENKIVRTADEKFPIQSTSTTQGTDKSSASGGFSWKSKSQSNLKLNSTSALKSTPKSCLKLNSKSSQSDAVSENQVYEKKSVPFSCPSTESYSSAESPMIPQRDHNFSPKIVLRIRSCLSCDHRLKFYEGSAMCTECKAICHNECQNNMPVPCIPIAKTPTTTKRRGHKLIDFTPIACPPEIRSLLRCIQEVDKRGLCEVNLYRVTASKEEMKTLVEIMFKRKRFPTLTNFHVHVICDCIIHILKMLHDCLIPRLLWADVISTAESQTFENKLASCQNVLGKLPKAYLTILAALILHLHRVAKSTICRINYSKLAETFGPIILGSHLSGSRIPSDIHQLQREQYEMMHLLFSIPENYWRLFESSMPCN